MQERIELSIDDGVAHVQLNRPEKMNALDIPMFEALIATGNKLKEEPGLRAVVISGKGRAFCAGLDLSNFADMGSAPSNLEPRTHGISNDVQYPVWVWRELQVPVIAAIHGATLGGGFQIALAADMRYAAPDVNCAIMEIRWGLVPDLGGSQLLRGLTRDDIARELSYTGRVFNADEALEYGLVTKIVEDPVEHALSVAREIAGKNPDAIRANKRIYNDLHYQTAASGLLQESIEQDRIIGGENQMEAVMASMEKRAANYKD